MKHPVSGLIIIAVCILTGAAFADNPAPYAGQQNGTHKTLSVDDISGLLKGEGMGLAKAAELKAVQARAMSSTWAIS